MAEWWPRMFATVLFITVSVSFIQFEEKQQNWGVYNDRGQQWRPTHSQRPTATTTTGPSQTAGDDVFGPAPDRRASRVFRQHPQSIVQQKRKRRLRYRDSIGRKSNRVMPIF